MKRRPASRRFTSFCDAEAATEREIKNTIHAAIHGQPSEGGNQQPEETSATVAAAPSVSVPVGKQPKSAGLPSARSIYAARRETARAALEQRSTKDCGEARSHAPDGRSSEKSFPEAADVYRHRRANKR
jgi:hypothetical protein